VRSPIKFRGSLLACTFAAPLWLAASLGASAAPAAAPAPDGSNEAAAAEVPRRIGRDRVDVESTKKIREFTTESGFSTSWVDHVPLSRRVTSPTKYLGHVVGAPGQLTPPEKINDYFRELARTSRNVEVFSMGKSHGGREMIVAAIGSPKNLRKLDAIKAAHRELADPRVTSEVRAREIASKTPPIYWVTAGLHSPETGPPEMVMELGFRLAVSDQRHIKEIRDEVVTLITPVLEMDGRARMVDWYGRHLTKVTDLEDSPPRMAPYWGDYTAHDNNRDGLQLSQPLTNNYIETYHEYLPVATLDLHESVPLLYVSSGTGPYNESIDPITISEWQWFSSYEVSEATKLGLRGVWTWGFYTGWYPGYLLWVSTNHNAVGRFYETFGNSNPGTFERNLRRSTYADRRVNTRQWYRAWPPEKDLTWSLRNNTNYMQTGVLASLQLAARNGDTLLFNFWKKNKNSLENGAKKAPHAFLIPADQRDRGALHRLLELLDRHRIEVHKLDEAGELGAGGESRELARGDYLVRLDQPYGNFARTLLQGQAFPKKASHTPYDDVAWSLDHNLGVEIQAIDDLAILDRPVTRVRGVPDLTEKIVGEGDVFLAEHRGQARLASFRWRLAGARVSALKEAWDGHSAGSLVIEGAARAQVEEAAKLELIDVVAIAGAPKVEMVNVNLPRVAVFHTWTYTQDSGWLRYTLETLGIPFTLINKDQLRAGDLKNHFDLIIVPSQAGMGLDRIVHGIDTKWGPMAYTKTEAYPSHGVIDASPDITGGMGFRGLGELESFVAEGGVLVTLGSGGRLAADGGLARPVSSRPSGDSPGSHVTTRVNRREHPLAWGYPETSHVFRGNLPNYSVREWDRGMVVMQYGTKTWAESDREADVEEEIATEGPGQPQATQATQATPREQAGTNAKHAKPPLVLSGLVKDPKALERMPALLDVPVGKGRVVIFSWNPAHRFMNHHDLGFLHNALMFFDDLPDTPTRDRVREDEAAREGR
jgi:hypothetical protein